MDNSLIHFELAGLWDDVVDDRPVISADHALVQNEEQKARLLEYLQKGAYVMQSAAWDPDFLSADATPAVPVMLFTDGKWIWGSEVEYYLNKYNYLPSADFIAHIVASNYTFETPGEEITHAAAAFMRQ